MTAPDLPLRRRVRGVLVRAKFPASPEYVARITEAALDDVTAVLADLVARGVAQEVPGRRGDPLYVLPDNRPDHRRPLTDGERIAAGLGTTWAPLPMGPGVSPIRSAA